LKPTILHLAKWYPNKIEPLLGIFVRKHIASTKKDFNHKVISIYSTDSFNTKITRITSDFEGIEEVLFYYKKGFFTKIKVLFKVWKEIQTSQNNIVHSHIISWTSTLAYLNSVYSKTPYFISEHWSGYHYKLFTKQNRFVKFFKCLTANKAKMIFPVSKSLKIDMLGEGIKANYKIIGNVVDGGIYDLPKNDKFTFVFVGDLDQKHKNVNGILNAFSELEKSSDVQLDIIGEGVDKQAYIDLAKRLNLSNSVKFYGSKSNIEVFESLTKSHVLVLNSNYETFSIICAEALLSGVPVITTRCGGPETFLDKQTGILIDVGNTVQLVEAMKEIQNEYHTFNPVYLKEKAKAYSMSTIGTELANNYKSALI